MEKGSSIINPSLANRHGRYIVQKNAESMMEPLLAEPVELPRPRLTAKGVGIAAVLWLLYAVLYTLLIVRDTGHAFLDVFSGQVFSNLILALYSIPLWWLVVHGLDVYSWRVRLAAYAVGGPVYAGLGLGSLVALVAVTTPLDVQQQIGSVAQWIFFTNLTIYGIQVAVFHAIRSWQRLRWRERQAAELMALARQRELAALKAQLNPHFLFNTLNSINAMVGQSPEEARAMIAGLAGLLRYALDSSRREWVPLAEEVKFVQAYLAVERRRFSDRLAVRYEIDPEALDVPVPPMLLQPLVENAVRHGIAPSEAGGTITVRIAAADGGLDVSVADTGAGAGPGPSGDGAGIGLAHTDARLRRLYGPEAALHAAPRTPGFEVRFRLPQPAPAP